MRVPLDVVLLRVELVVGGQIVKIPVDVIAGADLIVIILLDIVQNRVYRIVYRVGDVPLIRLCHAGHKLNAAPLIILWRFLLIGLKLDLRSLARFAAFGEISAVIVVAVAASVVYVDIVEFGIECLHVIGVRGGFR